MSFRPTLWATVAAVLVLAVLVGLGTWQLDRRPWKQELLKTRAQRITAPALAYPEVGQIETAEYRPIQMTGRYRPSDSLRLLSRTRDARAGFHVITPFQTDTTNAVVLVDRGWVPIDGDGNITPAPEGLVNVEGFVRRYETPGRFTPDNDATAGTWFYLDQSQLASALKIAVVAPFYVQLAPGASPPETYPSGGIPNTALRNPHLAYAVTWYALALVLLGIYVIFHARRTVGDD